MEEQWGELVGKGSGYLSAKRIFLFLFLPYILVSIVITVSIYYRDVVRYQVSDLVETELREQKQAMARYIEAVRPIQSYYQLPAENRPVNASDCSTLGPTDLDKEVVPLGSIYIRVDIQGGVIYSVLPGRDSMYEFLRSQKINDEFTDGRFSTLFSVNEAIRRTDQYFEEQHWIERSCLHYLQPFRPIGAIYSQVKGTPIIRVEMSDNAKSFLGASDLTFLVCSYNSDMVLKPVKVTSETASEHLLDLELPQKLMIPSDWYVQVNTPAIKPTLQSRWKQEKNQFSIPVKPLSEYRMHFSFKSSVPPSWLNNRFAQF